MKLDKKLIRTMVPFAPVALFFIAIVLLGTVFLRAYDTGHPIPYPSGSGLMIASPSVTPSEEPAAVASRPHLPSSLPAIEASTSATPMLALPTKKQTQQLRDTPHSASATFHQTLNTTQTIGEAAVDTVSDLPVVDQLSLNEIVDASLDLPAPGPEL